MHCCLPILLVCVYHSVLQTRSGRTLKCNFFGSVPLGQSLPCHICSESPSISSLNYRFLKLQLGETGHHLLTRIQKMLEVDKSGHVVGFIIGSTNVHTSKLPEDVFKEIVRFSQDKQELPPLIILKEGDYDLFHKHTVSHNSLVEVKCLSNIGSKFMIAISLMALAVLCLML